MVDIFLMLCGSLCIAFAFFHLLFWRLFSWKFELPLLMPINKSIVQTLNVAVFMSLIFMGATTLVFHEELPRTPLGRFILYGFAAFWLMRTICQFVFFKMRESIYWILAVVFFMMTVGFTMPIIII